MSTKLWLLLFLACPLYGLSYQHVIIHQDNLSTNDQDWTVFDNGISDWVQWIDQTECAEEDIEDTGCIKLEGDSYISKVISTWSF